MFSKLFKYQRCIILTCSLILVQGCGSSSEDESASPVNTSPVNTSPVNTVPSNLVGEWIYVDNGKSFYLDAASDLVFTKVDNNLIEIPTDDNYNRYAIRSGISNSNVNGSVYIPSESASTSRSSYQAISSRSSGTSGIAGIDVILQNVEDDSIEVTVTTDSNGDFSSDAIPTGDYVITASNGDGSFETEASISGTATDLGIYTLNEDNEYNFKASLDMGFIYGDYQEVSGSISIHNIGSMRGTGLSYHFTCEHELIQSCIIDQEPGSIEPGSEKTFPVSIQFKYLDNDKESITIPVVIRDVNGKEWTDYVSLTVYKRFTNINIKANSSSVSGYLISPGHLPKEVTTSNGTIKVPYLPGEQYQLIFSNTSISTETAYSIGFDTVVNNIEGYDDTGSFEPNNTESEGVAVQPLQAISSYLHIGDIDYYTIEMPAEFTQAAKIEFYSILPMYDAGSLGNSDQILNKGETGTFEIAIQNTGFIQVEGVSINLSSTDEFITITDADNSALLDLPTNTIINTAGRLTNNSHYGRVSSNASFTVMASLVTPENHSAAVNVTMTDLYGNQWLDTFQLSVQKTAANLVFFGISPLADDYHDYHGVTGNSDMILNQGEVARFSITVENTGTSTANKVQMEISSLDTYLTFDEIANSVQDDDIPAESTVDSDGYQSGNSNYLRKSVSNDFRVTAASDTPAGHVATANLLMTDEYGNTWSDTFEVTVEGIAANLSYKAISSFADITNSSYETTGNSDGILNQGETATFSIAVENTGTSTANKVEMEISSSDTYLTFERISTQGNDIPAGATVDNDGLQSSSSYYLRNSLYLHDYRVTAASDTPSGHVATVNLLMTDEYGNTWSDTFEVTVEGIAANLSFKATSSFYDGISGNNGTTGNSDKILNQGETATFSIAVENTGTSQANKVEMEISSSDTYLTFERISTQGNDIPAGATVDNDGYQSSNSLYLHYSYFLPYHDYRVTAASDTPAGHVATVNLLMSDEYGNTWIDTFTITTQ
jgi:hypothetical protein